MKPLRDFTPRWGKEEDSWREVDGEVDGFNIVRGKMRREDGKERRL